MIPKALDPSWLGTRCVSGARFSFSQRLGTACSHAKLWTTFPRQLYSPGCRTLLGRVLEERPQPASTAGASRSPPAAAPASPRDDWGPARAPPPPLSPVHRCTPNQVCANVLPSLEKSSGEIFIPIEALFFKRRKGRLPAGLQVGEFGWSEEVQVLGEEGDTRRPQAVGRGCSPEHPTLFPQCES